jgi:rod shape-determining protein MreC
MDKDKRSANLSVIVYGIVSLSLIFLPTKVFVSTARTVMGYTLLPFIFHSSNLTKYLHDVPQNVRNLINSAEENKVLHAELKELQLVRLRYEEIENENKRLTKLLDLAPHSKWKGVWARVIEKDPSHLYDSVLINKGERDGIKMHQSVIGVNDDKIGLIGRVSDVYARTAKISLITNPKVSVVTHTKDKNFDGLIMGNGSKELTLKYMPAESNVSKGLELVTSSSSVVFVPGISIGNVISFEPQKHYTAFVSGEVSPIIDPATVREMFVITQENKDEI